MSDWGMYLHNSHWRANYARALRPMNGIMLPKYQQGSVGGNSPMFIHSDGHTHIQIDGQPDSSAPYKTTLKGFSPLVTKDLQRQVQQCTNKTHNPTGCTSAAVRQIYSGTYYSKPYDPSRRYHTH